MQRSVFIFLHGLLGVSSTTEGFLKQSPKSRFNLGDQEFQQAFASVMGCSSDGKAGSDIVDVKMSLLPMWHAAPKDAEGRLEWRTVRYLAHRYFMQKSSLLIRGLEPGRHVSELHSGTADILRNQAPSLASVLDNRLASQGFSLDDVASVVAALEKVIFDSEASMLEIAYRQQNQAMDGSLSEREMSNVVLSYVIHWLFGDQGVANRLLNRPHLLNETVPHWTAIHDFTQGLVKNMEFMRARSPLVGQGANIMGQRYSFEDAHKAVASITHTFGSFWHHECEDIQTSLAAMDKTGTGRVLLTDFYAAKAAGDWRFAESEQYLRELGALDDSLGTKKVIISNYLLGPNNCVVTNSHYFVCCTTACEATLNEIEDRVGSPVALPQDILIKMAHITTYDDEPLKLTATLTAQLERIAETHGGKVPLHGRLFAQWLHYVLPMECPFPHKAGTTTSNGPVQYGDSAMVEDSVVESHVSMRNEANATDLIEELDEAQWMAHWSEDEELIADYSQELRAPWDSHRPGRYAAHAGLALLLALLLLGAGAASSKDKLHAKLASAGSGIVCETKSHLV